MIYRVAVFCLLLTILTTSLSQALSICGDCNQDGSGPDILDALLAAQIDVGLVLPSVEQSMYCDVDNNASVNVLDALSIAQAAAGLPNITLNCSPPTTREAQIP